MREVNSSEQSPVVEVADLSVLVPRTNEDYDPMAAVKAQAARFSEGIGKIGERADEAGAYKNSKGLL